MVWLQNDSISFGSRAEISCSKGFRSVNMVDKILVECGDEGWFRVEPPALQRPFRCRPVRCPHPRHPSNGRSHFNDRNVGAVIEFTCKPGFTLSEESPKESVCQGNGSWTVGAPQLGTLCVRMRPCPEPEVPLNGYMNITPSQADFSCDPGFQLVGSPVLHCSDGTW